jgi:carboxylesterase type B
VNDGQDGRVCPQGYVLWAKERGLFEKAYLANPNNISSFTSVPPPGVDPKATPPRQDDARANEDCLFMDVFALTEVYEKANACEKNTTGAPVLVCKS